MPRFLLVILVTSCTRNVAPPVIPTAPRVVPTRNRAETFSEPFSKSLGLKCSAWSGRGTELPDEVDAVLCQGDTWLLYCAAPDNDKPKCEMAIDWGQPKVEQSKAPPVVEPMKPTKPEPKKK